MRLQNQTKLCYNVTFLLFRNGISVNIIQVFLQLILIGCMSIYKKSEDFDESCVLKHVLKIDFDYLCLC